MTRKLSELFDLPLDEDFDETLDKEETVIEQNRELVVTDTMNNLEKIDSALPAIKGLESADAEMDEIAQLAIDSYKDLMDLGMNVEARVASDILSSASQFLGHAITAKDAKIRKKLKMIELQLRKAKLDQDERKMQKETGNDDEETSEGKMMDRNELLAEIMKQNKEEQEKDKPSPDSSKKH